MGRINSFVLCTTSLIMKKLVMAFRAGTFCYGRINLHEENHDIGSLWTRMMRSSSLIADWRIGEEGSAYRYHLLAAYGTYISHQGRTLKFDNF